MDKIDKLKQGIDKEMKEDALKYTKKKDSTPTFNLKPVGIKSVEKTLIISKGISKALVRRRWELPLAG